MTIYRRAGAARAGLKVLLLGTALSFGSAVGAWAAPQCTTAGTGQAIALPKAADTLARSHHLTIVAIGSSSTAGVGSSGPTKTYPAVLEATLRTRFPGADITVINKGVGGEDVPENLLRFERDVAANKPDVVLWQIGTNYALRHLGVAKFAPQLQAGIELIRSYGAEAILIDPQYAPWANLDPDTAAITASIASVGRSTGVPVMERYVLMKRWVEEDKVPLSSLIVGDGLHLSDWSYDCFARTLGNRLAAGLAAPPAIAQTTPAHSVSARVAPAVAAPAAAAAAR